VKKQIILIGLLLIMVMCKVGCNSEFQENTAIENNDEINYIVEDDEKVSDTILDETTTEEQTESEGDMYQLISDYSTLPENIQKMLVESRAQRGYYILETGFNEYVVIVFSGPKNTGGHSIRLETIIVEDGITKVVVSEHRPPEGSLVTMMFTYPIIVFKTNNSTGLFEIQNTSDYTFEYIKVKQKPINKE